MYMYICKKNFLYIHVCKNILSKTTSDLYIGYYLAVITQTRPAYVKQKYKSNITMYFSVLCSKHIVMGNYL